MSTRTPWRGHGGDRRDEPLKGIAEARTGRKGVSLTHLAGFHFERTKEGVPLAPLHRRRVVPFIRERYVQANFRFVVAEHGADYTFFLADPDRLVDWDLVEEVVVTSHEVVTCPVCLFEPTAAKITKCGHIFCWPCILNYLAREAKAHGHGSGCPLCKELIRASEIKSVIVNNVDKIREGDLASFVLCRRTKGSSTVQPRGALPTLKAGEVPPASHPCAPFCKLTVADRPTLLALLERERNELTAALGDTAILDPTWQPSIIAAMQRLQRRQAALQASAGLTASTEADMCDYDDDIAVLNAALAASAAELTAVVDSSQPAAGPPSPPSTQSVETAPRRPALSAAASEFRPGMPAAAPAAAAAVSAAAVSAAAPPGLAHPRTHALPIPAGRDTPTHHPAVSPRSSPPVVGSVGSGGASAADESHYLYQASSGQIVFLSAVNIKCLQTEFGPHARWPDTVRGRVLELQTMTMTEAIRKRFRFLDHLPLACDFAFCELDLSGVVSTQTLRHHADELQSRQRAREKAKRAERVASARQEVESRREMKELQAFLDEIASTGAPPPPEQPPVLDPTPADTLAGPAQPAAYVPFQPQPVSFRNIVRGPAVDDTPEPEPVPGAALSFRQALLHQQQPAQQQQHVGWGGAGAGGGGKKKKGKAVVLLSTGGARRM